MPAWRIPTPFTPFWKFHLPSPRHCTCHRPSFYPSGRLLPSLPPTLLRASIAARLHHPPGLAALLAALFAVPSSATSPPPPPARRFHEPDARDATRAQPSRHRPLTPPPRIASRRSVHIPRPARSDLHLPPSGSAMSAVAGTAPGPPAALDVSPTASRKASNAAAAAPDKEKEKRYKCQFCNRAFSRSEHRSRHERSRKYIPAPQDRDPTRSVAGRIRWELPGSARPVAGTRRNGRWAGGALPHRSLTRPCQTPRNAPSNA